MYLSDTNFFFFSMKLSFDGLQTKGRQGKWLLPFQQKTGNRVVPKGNALKRLLLQQLQVLCWELPGRQWLLQVRRSLAEFGFMLCVCDHSVAGTKEPYPPQIGKVQSSGWSSQAFLI